MPELTREAVAAAVAGTHGVDAGQVALGTAGYATHRYRTNLDVTLTSAPGVLVYAQYRPAGAGGLAGLVGSAWVVRWNQDSGTVEVAA